MIKNVLLDTSVVIRHFREGNIIINHLVSCEELYLPQIALAELYAGAFRSSQPERNIFQIERFLETVTVLNSNESTPILYGRISAQLAKVGKPIPQNDIWIAALAIQFDLPLATSDFHFQHVVGLNVLLW